MDVLPLEINFETDSVQVAVQATSLNDDFFDEEDLEFGAEFSNDWERAQYYRTTSGRAATVLMQAEDEDEKIGVLKFEDGASEIRRFQSYKPCLFGPALSSDAEDFESDDEEEETDTSELEALEEIEPMSSVGGDVHTDLPSVAILSVRRNRGASWLKMNSFGELFDPEEKEESESPKKRLVMDAFGNFVVSGSDEKRRDPHLEYLKMRQNRLSSLPKIKRGPSGSPISKRSGIKSRLKSFFSRA